MLADGVYHAALPETPGGAPAVIWLHGFGRSGAEAVANSGFAKGFTERGYTLIAPDGLPWNGEGSEPEFDYRDQWKGPRDDIAFIGAVIDDAAARFGFDRSRVLLAGFSTGGSMVWDVACLRPDIAAAYAPISGGFWEPAATDCRGPVDLLHTHGFADMVVPLEGRIADEYPPYVGVQADIHAGLLYWRDLMHCGRRADAVDTAGPLWRKTWTSCEGGSVTFLLGPHGHSIPDGWTDLALDWFEAVTAEKAKGKSANR